MPFRRRHLHPVHTSSPEQRLAEPLALLEERLVTASSSLDDLTSDLGDVASLIREMAEQVANQTGGERNA